MREFSKVQPLEAALAAVDSPSAVADRRKRAQKWAEELEGRDRGVMFMYASPAEWASIREPFRTPHIGTQLHGSSLADAERKAGRAADAVILNQCEIALRARDVAAVYADSDRLEDERVRALYNKSVTAAAWAQGNREAQFIARFAELIAARRDAEAFGDADGIRAAEARLNRLTGVPYPTLPEAAWAAADEIPTLADRQAEYERLELKYGPRNPDANDAGTKTSRKRMTTRPMSALTTTR